MFLIPLTHALKILPDRYKNVKFVQKKKKKT